MSGEKEYCFYCGEEIDYVDEWKVCAKCRKARTRFCFDEWLKQRGTSLDDIADYTQFLNLLGEYNKYKSEL